MKHHLSWRGLTTRHLLVILPPALLFALALERVEDPDLWWHLKTGEWILEHRAIPRVGLWSWVGVTKPWVTHEWLFEVGAATLYRLGGLQALVIAKAALIAGAFALVLRHARRASGSLSTAALLALVAGIASRPFWSERPQLITYLLVAYWLLSLDRWRDGGQRHLWAFPPLVLIWANLHGAYVLGFALLALYGLAELCESVWAGRCGGRAAWGRVRHVALVGAACAACALVNPHGVTVFTYPLRYVGAGPLTRYVEEWLSPNFRDPVLFPFGLFLLGTIGIMAASPLRPRGVHLALLLVFTAMALYSQRNMPLMLIVATPIVAPHLRALLDVAGQHIDVPAQEARQMPALNWAILAAAVAVAMLRLPRGVHWQELVQPGRYPERAVAFLKRHPLPGRMLNDYGWGGYLIWRLSPRYQVFVDGRADIFGDQVLLDFVAVHRVQPRWREVLDRYRIRWVLWPADKPLAQVLAASDNWREVYRDDLAVIFVRR